ncbi:hypothetical protein Tco_0001288 [Tanacetum coccineum]
MNTSQDIKMQMVDDNVGNQVRQNAVQNDGNEVGQNAVQNPAPAEGNGNGITDGSTEVPKDENCYDHDIFNMLTHKVQYIDLQTELDRTKQKLENFIIKKEKEYDVLWNNWYAKCKECKYNKISYDKAYNDMQKKIEWLQAQLGDLKGKSSDTQCASNTLDPVSQKLKDENVSLEFQVSEPKGTTKGTRMNTRFTKKSILGKPHSSSSSGLKLYSVTPFPKSSVLPKVDKTNALSKPVTSNSVLIPFFNRSYLAC